MGVFGRVPWKAKTPSQKLRAVLALGFLFFAIPFPFLAQFVLGMTSDKFWDGYYNQIFMGILALILLGAVVAFIMMLFEVVRKKFKRSPKTQTNKPKPEPRREHKSLSVEKQNSRYISERSFDELREESLEIDHEVRRDYTLSFIATGVLVLGSIVAWIWGAPSWVKISLFVLSVLGIAVSGGFIWGMRQDRDWQGVGNILSDDPNNWSDAILRKRAVSVQSQMDDKRPFDEQPIPSSSEAQALEVLGMTAPYTLDELKKRRNIIMRKIHPDQGGSALMVRLVNEAYDVLKVKK